MTLIETTNLTEAVELMVAKGGYTVEELNALQGWLDRGDDVLVFELADLSVVLSGNYALYWAMPWERDEPTPRQAPDTVQCGLGWRYLPAMRITAPCGFRWRQGSIDTWVTCIKPKGHEDIPHECAEDRLPA